MMKNRKLKRLVRKGLATTSRVDYKSGWGPYDPAVIGMTKPYQLRRTHTKLTTKGVLKLKLLSNKKQRIKTETRLQNLARLVGRKGKVSPVTLVEMREYLGRASDLF